MFRSLEFLVLLALLCSQIFFTDALAIPPKHAYKVFTAPLSQSQVLLGIAKVDFAAPSPIMPSLEHHTISNFGPIDELISAVYFSGIDANTGLMLNPSVALLYNDGTQTRLRWDRLQQPGQGGGELLTDVLEIEKVGGTGLTAIFKGNRFEIFRNLALGNTTRETLRPTEKHSTVADIGQITKFKWLNNSNTGAKTYMAITDRGYLVKLDLNPPSPLILSAWKRNLYSDPGFSQERFSMLHSLFTSKDYVVACGKTILGDSICAVYKTASGEFVYKTRDGFFLDSKIFFDLPGDNGGVYDIAGALALTDSLSAGSLVYQVDLVRNLLTLSQTQTPAYPSAYKGGAVYEISLNTNRWDWSFSYGNVHHGKPGVEPSFKNVQLASGVTPVAANPQPTKSLRATDTMLKLFVPGFRALAPAKKQFLGVSNAATEKRSFLDLLAHAAEHYNNIHQLKDKSIIEEQRKIIFSQLTLEGFVSNLIRLQGYGLHNLLAPQILNKEVLESYGISIAFDLAQIVIGFSNTVSRESPFPLEAFAAAVEAGRKKAFCEVISAGNGFQPSLE